MATIERARETVLETGPDRIEIGNFAPSIPMASARPTLVLVSYNIRYAVGSFLITGSIARRLGLTFPAHRPSLVERNLHRAALTLSDGQRLPPADIVALQETDKLTARAGRQDVARGLAQELRMHYARGSALTSDSAPPKSNRWYLDFEEHIQGSDSGDTGIAILSRLPFEAVARVELPWSECEWRPKLALAATIRNGEQELRIFNAHIDPHASMEGQLEQHEAILAQAADSTCPTILLGDFNTLSKRSCRAMRALLERHGFTTPFPTRTSTWRAGLIRLHTDWIFIRGAKVSRYGVARVMGVSDHWPVWVEVDLTSGADA